jgi:hypothetical protein
VQLQASAGQIFGGCEYRPEGYPAKKGTTKLTTKTKAMAQAKTAPCLPGNNAVVVIMAPMPQVFAVYFINTVEYASTMKMNEGSW